MIRLKHLQFIWILFRYVNISRIRTYENILFLSKINTRNKGKYDIIIKPLLAIAHEIAKKKHIAIAWNNLYEVAQTFDFSIFNPELWVLNPLPLFINSTPLTTKAYHQADFGHHSGFCSSQSYRFYRFKKEQWTYHV